MLQKNSQNIYQWSIGKTANEVQEQIKLLQTAIEMAKKAIVIAKTQTMSIFLKKELVKKMKHVIEKNEEAISFLKMELAMKHLKDGA